MDNIILKVKNLTKVFPNGKVANDNINLNVKKGEIVGIIGPNGAGKSTLIRQILGLIKPSKGIIKVFNESPNEKLVKQKIGYVPQYPLNFPSLKIKEILKFILRQRGLSKRECKEKIEKYLEIFNFTSFAEYFGYQLSGGWTKLLLIVAAFIQEPELLILDEPSNMLDIVNKFNVWDYIKKSNKTILLASHDMNEIKNLCNKVFIIVDGKIVSSGHPHEITFFESLPVEVKIVPENEKKFVDFISKSTDIINYSKGPMFNISLKNISYTIEFLKQIKNIAGIKYINLESPSFEKVIMKLVEGSNE